MSIVTLAFYKGRGDTWWKRIQDSAIRTATWSRYSHVELICTKATLGQEHICLSASGRDGGVREKEILLKPESWDLLMLDCDADYAGTFIRDRIGQKYDFKGIVFSQALPWDGHNKDRWFCSEICAAALKKSKPNWYSPKRLYKSYTQPSA